MALGTIRRQSPQGPFSQVQATPAVFGAGVGQAIETLAGAVGDYATTRQNLTLALRQRTERQESFDVQRRFIEHQGSIAQYYATRTRDSGENVAGFTDATAAEIQQMNSAFLDSVPQHLRGEYEVRLAQIQQERTLEAFNFEYNQGNEFFRLNIQDTLNSTLTGLQTGDIPFDQAVSQVHDLIAASDLPELEKQKLYRDTSSVLASVEFTREVGAAMQTNAPVGTPDGSDVVAPGMSPGHRAALNAISGPESGGLYNVRYTPNGAATFDDYSDHPRIAETRPDGRTSTAAGRYQFVASTWDRAVAMFNRQNPNNPVRDFSPVSQDRIAAFWVEYQFNTRNDRGLTFDEVMSRMLPSELAYMRQVLTPEWEGLGNLSDAEWFAMVQSSAGLGGTGTAQAPDIWTDPRFEDIPYDAKLALANQAQSDLLAANRQAAEAAENARMAALETANQGAFNGRLTVDDIPDLWEQGVFRELDDERLFRTRLAEGRERERSTLELEAQMATGRPISPARSSMGLDGLIGEQGRNGLRAMDGAEAGRVAQLIQRAGFIPPETQGVLSAMLNGPLQDQRAFALGVLSSLPDQVLRAGGLEGSGLSAEDAADVAYFRRLAPFFSGDPAGQQQLLQRLDEFRSGTNEQQREFFEREATDFFNDSYVTPQSLTPIFDTALSREPVAPSAETNAGAILMTDARDAFVEGWQRYGTQEGAQTFMEEYLRRTWGPSYLGGGDPYLVKYPPEITYSGMQLNGNLDWLEAQVREDYALPADATFQLVAMPETLSDIQSGVPNPRYGVVVTDAAGISHFMPDRFQGVHTPEVLSEADRVAEQAFAARRLEEFRYVRDRAEQRLRDLTPRVGAELEIQAAQEELAAAEERLRGAEVTVMELQTDTIRDSLNEISNAFGADSEVVTILSRLESGESPDAVADLARLREIRDNLPGGLFAPLELRVRNNLLTSVIDSLTRE